MLFCTTVLLSCCLTGVLLRDLPTAAAAKCGHQHHSSSSSRQARQQEGSQPQCSCRCPGCCCRGCCCCCPAAAPQPVEEHGGGQGGTGAAVMVHGLACTVLVWCVLCMFVVVGPRARGKLLTDGWQCVQLGAVRVCRLLPSSIRNCHPPSCAVAAAVTGVCEPLCPR